MAVTDIDTSNLTKYKFSESAKMSDIFSDQVEAFFDQNYWGEYNYIKPDENIQIAIEKLSNKLRKRQTHPWLNLFSALAGFFPAAKVWFKGKKPISKHQ